MIFWLRKTICAAILFLLPVVLHAQHGYTQFYTIENLISKELIKSIAKDEDGYLWIATDDGILRYDGYQTQVFFKELPTHYTKGFLKKKNGKFFVVHDHGMQEIIKANDNIFFKPFTMGEKIYHERLNYPKSAYEDVNGNLWIGEMNALLLYSENGLTRFDLGEEFRSIDYHRTFSFTEDAFGNLWIAPFKGPLLFYDKQSKQIEKISIPQAISQVTGIASAKGDYLLLGGKEGILKLKVDSDHQILESVLLTDIQNISVIKCINHSDVYVGTRNIGLYQVDLRNPSAQLKRVQNIPINDIVDLFFDATKSELWVAGSESIGLFKPSIVSTLRQAGKDRIESLTLNEQNGLYYSIGSELFYLHDFTTEESAQRILATNETYYARILLEGDKLWIGDAFGKIFYYDLNKKSMRYLVNRTDNSVQYLFNDMHHNKWFTGLSKGMVKIDANENVTHYASLNQTVLLRESKHGDLYCIQSKKAKMLFIYDHAKDTFNTINLAFQFNCPEDIIINDFQFDAMDNLWIGTNEGLLRIENEKGTYRDVNRISIEGLQPDGPVRALAIVDDYICFATSNGLAIYKDGSYILFNQGSGLPSKILKERGLVVDKRGNLLVSTAKGMAVIKKEAIIFRATLQPIFKTVMVNGAPLDVHALEQLPFPNKTKLEVEFISLSFPASNIIYQTRILGIDKNWSAPSVSRTLSVLGFSEGNYTLEVRAREDGKLWSDPLSLKFEIARPWYATWWALVLFCCCGIIIIVVATSIHNNNLIRQKKNLKKTVEERTDEINRQKNELIEQQKKIIQQKEEIIVKNEAVYKSQQALNEADMNYHQLKEKQLQDQIDYRNKQITTHALNILQKNESLSELRNQLEEMVKNTSKISIPEIRKTLKTIDESFKLDKDWDDFKLYFEQIYTGFYSKLKINYPELTPLELRHCALIRLNLTSTECASILGISPDSLKVSRTRLRKKLNLTPNQSLTDFLLGI